MSVGRKFFSFIFIFDYLIFAKDLNIVELEKRVIYLENQISELKYHIQLKSINKKKWDKIKSGDNKKVIKNTIGTPDRIGKFKNGGEIWGFNNHTLIFDKYGKLKNWSKPFAD